MRGSNNAVACLPIVSSKYDATDQILESIAKVENDVVKKVNCLITSKKSNNILNKVKSCKYGNFFLFVVSSNYFVLICS